MLSVRVTGPRSAIDRVLPRLRERASVTGLMILRDVLVESAEEETAAAKAAVASGDSEKDDPGSSGDCGSDAGADGAASASAGSGDRPMGDALEFMLAREDANGVTAMLQGAGLEQSGSIQLSSLTTVISDAADAADDVGPGDDRDDAVIWDQVAAMCEDNAHLTATFMAFLVLAALIAGVGRIEDQPILIIGAMVVGPEFAPISALAFGIAFGRIRMGLRAIATLLIGFSVAIAVSWLGWGLAYLGGAITKADATTGEQTAFIVQPDLWSLVIAVLAGITGVLSMTTSKSSILVGVFISITTIPAVAVIGLALAVGAWSQALGALVQLGVNVAGLIASGTATLLIMRLAGPHISSFVVGLRLRRRSSPAALV